MKLEEFLSELIDSINEYERLSELYKGVDLEKYKKLLKNVLAREENRLNKY